MERVRATRRRPGHQANAFMADLSARVGRVAARPRPRRVLIEPVRTDALIRRGGGHEARSAARLPLAGEPILPDRERIRTGIFPRDNLP